MAYDLTPPSSLISTDQDAARGATAPRVSLQDIEDAISLRIEFTGDEVWDKIHFDPDLAHASKLDMQSLKVLSICLLVMANGFTVIGKSAPAHPDNYDKELGYKLAYEDAIRQLWPLMGYALRDRLWRDSEDAMEHYR